MKVNKTTIYVCCLALIVLTVILMFSEFITTTIQEMISGVFTGFIVSLVILFVGYFHEKNKILDQTERNLKSLYISMHILSKITGNISQQIYTTYNLSSLQFGLIPKMAEQSIEFMNNMGLGMFDPFCDKGYTSVAFDRLTLLQQKIYTVKNISMNLEVTTLKHTLKVNQIETLLKRGEIVPQNTTEEVNVLKNFVNIRTAKLHEYETSITLELEDIAQTFYKCDEIKDSWQDVKENLLKQIEEITRSNL